MNPNPKTVEEVINDFKGRRIAIVKALTQDVDEFYQLCHPNTSKQLCLYGFPNQHWDVNLPPNSDLPNPKLGINVGRDSMNSDDWVSMVAVHSEVWLQAVASYFAIKLKFNNADKKLLSNTLMDFPSICDVLTRPTLKRARKIVEVLPQDLMVLVLARLPVKDLLKYRSVSKTFRALIDNPNFVNTHLDFHNNNCKKNPFLVIERPNNWRKSVEVLIRCWDSFRKVKELDHFKTVPKTFVMFYELNYVNGLMLLALDTGSQTKELVLWNPSINKSLYVSCSALRVVKNTCYSFGLGFDASRDDYKVIAILCPGYYFEHHQSFDGSVPSFVQVYMLSTNSWTTKVGVHPPWNRSLGQPVFASGAIHWKNPRTDLVYTPRGESRDSHLVAFDVSKEVFSYIELPSGDTDLLEKEPIVLDGVIGMFYKYFVIHDVWVMEQYGVPDSWTIRYRFNLKLRSGPTRFMSDGELLFETASNGRGISSFDVKKELLRELSEDCRLSNYKIYNYVESLVLLQSGK